MDRTIIEALKLKNEFDKQEEWAKKMEVIAEAIKEVIRAMPMIDDEDSDGHDEERECLFCHGETPLLIIEGKFAIPKFGMCVYFCTLSRMIMTLITEGQFKDDIENIYQLESIHKHVFHKIEKDFSELAIEFHDNQFLTEWVKRYNKDF